MTVAHGADGHPTRRSVMRCATAAAGALGGAALGLVEPSGAAALSAPVVPGTVAQAMAMHVHASFSEGGGSLQAALSEAASLGVKALFWTEHDWRMTSRDYRSLVSFTGNDDVQFGSPWSWDLMSSGAPVSSSTQLPSSIGSPWDPVAGGGLHVTVHAQPAQGWGAVGYQVNSDASRNNCRGNIAGLSISFDVLPTVLSADGYAELLLTLSMRPATGGRTAGSYQISYRIGGSDAIGYSTKGILGIVRLPDPTSNRWITITVDPVLDAAALWPDLIAPADNALYDIAFFVAARNGALADAVFDHLVMSWNHDWAQAVDLQKQIMATYASQPGIVGHDIAQYRALELSWYGVHLNWFGPDPWPVASPGAQLNAAVPTGWETSAIRQVHSHAGLVSYNHPYGSSESSIVLPNAQRGAKRLSAAAELVPQRLYGADALEVGMLVRAGMPMADHLWLWDVLTRNELVISGTGTNDDHTASPGVWARMGNRFLTYAWAASTTQSDLLAAVSAGRCFVADPVSTVRGLDVVIDSGAAIMGQVLVSSYRNRTITFHGTGLPASAVVTVLQVPVDSISQSDPGTVLVSTLPGSAFASGTASVSLPASAPWRLSDAAYRMEIHSSTGRPLAFTQPIWVVTSAPAGAGNNRVVHQP